MGVWLRTDSRFREFLSERSLLLFDFLTIIFRYRQAVAEAFWEAPTLFVFSYIMIVLGCCMIVVAFFGELSIPSLKIVLNSGCCGVTGVGSRVCLIVYSIAVFLLLIFTLASGIFLLYKRDGVGFHLIDFKSYLYSDRCRGLRCVELYGSALLSRGRSCSRIFGPTTTNFQMLW